MTGKVPVHPRPLRFEGDLAYVPLTRGMEAVIDAADAPLVAQRSWYAHRQGTNVYALAKKKINGKKVMLMMHRVIIGPTSKPFVDHVDGNGLNNRRNNLREASYLENSRNSCGKRAYSRSGFKGVVWIKRTQNWEARIGLEGRRTRYLGSFADAEEAARAVDAAARVEYGEFARLNFPDQEPRP